MKVSSNMAGRKWPNVLREIFPVCGVQRGKCTSAVALPWKNKWHIKKLDDL